MDPYIYILDNKKRPGDVLELKETIKDTLVILKEKKLMNVKKVLQNQGLPRTKKILILELSNKSLNKG